MNQVCLRLEVLIECKDCEVEEGSEGYPEDVGDKNKTGGF